jgi:hypothetical protein
VADRSSRRSERELERALVDLGRRIAFPPTPDLAGRVRVGLDTATRRSRRPFGFLYSWPRVAATLAALLLLTVIVGLTPPVREAVAGWLELRGVRFFTVPETPAGTAVPTGVPSPAALTADGRLVTLDQVRREVTFPVLVPSSALVGVPDEVYVAEEPVGGRVTLLYRPRPGLPEAREAGTGLLITQFRGGLVPFIQKGLPPGSTVQAVAVAGAPGFWVEGEPHVLIFRDATGQFREQPSRLAGNTLLWERDGITYRLESALGRDEAIRIAESMR